jgi:hypothetical protein
MALWIIKFKTATTAYSSYKIVRAFLAALNYEGGINVENELSLVNGNQYGYARYALS